LTRHRSIVVLGHLRRRAIFRVEADDRLAAAYTTRRRGSGVGRGVQVGGPERAAASDGVERCRNQRERISAGGETAEVVNAIVRGATGDDFDAWFELFQEVADEGRWIWREGPLDRDERRQAFERALDDSDIMTFLAEADGLLLGVLGVTLADGRAELGMMVRKEHRGQGIGSSLLEACVAWCRDRDAHKLALTVWPHNKAAMSLYRKFGFRVEGRLVRHYRRRSGELWDALAMGLILDSSSPGSSYDDEPTG
jgi:RimJ/RimL family protein N-acetyltransferase